MGHIAPQNRTVPAFRSKPSRHVFHELVEALVLAVADELPDRPRLVDLVVVASLGGGRPNGPGTARLLARLTAWYAAERGQVRLAVLAPDRFRLDVLLAVRTDTLMVGSRSRFGWHRRPPSLCPPSISVGTARVRSRIRA